MTLRKLIKSGIINDSTIICIRDDDFNVLAEGNLFAEGNRFNDDVYGYADHDIFSFTWDRATDVSSEKLFIDLSL